MADVRYLDFDAMVAENEHIDEPLPVMTYRGMEYTLPREMPAMVMLKTLKISKMDLTSIKDEDFVQDMQLVFESMLGDQLDALLSTGISIEDLGTLLKGFVQLYSGNATTPPVTETAAGAE